MKKIVLSLAAAGAMSGALAQEVPNLANIAPSNYGSYVPTLDFYVKGKDITDSVSFAVGLDNKFGLAQAIGGELYIRLTGHLGYRGKSAQKFGELNGGLGWSQQLSENQFAAVELGYKYGLSTGDKPDDLKNWREYGVSATYGYKLTDWLALGVSGFFDKTKNDTYAIKGIKGSSYGFGVPISINISEAGNINIYGGYQTQKIDNSDLKKSRPIIYLGATTKF